MEMEMETLSPLILHSNRQFLKLYHRYVIQDWRIYYLVYDELKAMYKDIKNAEDSREELRKFEEKFSSDIRRVDAFMKGILDESNVELNKLNDWYESKTLANKVTKYAEQQFETEMREMYDRLRKCKQFYRLNHFVALKIGKKYEKLLEKDGARRNPLAENENFQYWIRQESYIMLNSKFVKNEEKIATLVAKCKDSYQRICRKKYSFLTDGELYFMKLEDGGLSDFWKVAIGIKVFI